MKDMRMMKEKGMMKEKMMDDSSLHYEVEGKMMEETDHSERMGYMCKEV